MEEGVEGDAAHHHRFLGAEHDRNGRRTWTVAAISALAMGVEVAGGAAFHSMGLVAEGLHMGAHVAVLAAAGAAYSYARRHQDDPRFSFGAGKLGDLAAFASAVVLALVALLIAGESLQRLLHPQAAQFAEAIWIGVVGLLVSLASASLLHDAEHRHGTSRGDRDLNMRAAYLHLVGDVAVSVLAIVGLLAGRFLSWGFADPLAGLIGAAVVARFAGVLAVGAGAALVDMDPDPGLAEAIRNEAGTLGAEIADLHLWRLGPGHRAAILSLVCDDPHGPAWYKARMATLRGLSHVTLEVNAAPRPVSPALSPVGPSAKHVRPGLDAAVVSQGLP